MNTSTQFYTTHFYRSLCRSRSQYEVIVNTRKTGCYSGLNNRSHLPSAVADPGFPRGGGTNPSGGRQHTIWPNFPKNCMKLKEFGPPGVGGGARLSRPSATDRDLMHHNQWRIQDFPEGVHQFPKVLLFFKFFAENCMEMKEFGPGGRVPGAPLGSANDNI